MPTKIFHHAKKHHKKYVGGLFASFAVIKTFGLIMGFFGISLLGSTFAAGDELNSTNITEAPYNCAVDATDCNLSNLNIGSIAPGTFANHTSLSYLYLDGNLLTSINAGDFAGLDNLSSLYLIGNQISSIAENSFAELPSLFEVQLYNNQITTLPESIMSLSIGSINIDNNKICFSLLSTNLLDFINNLIGSTWQDTQDTSSCPLPPAFSCDTVTDISTGECEGLVALYSGTNGDNWTNNTNWTGDTTIATVCDWFGITCTSNHVTAIQLSNNNLSGILPLEIKKLPYLITLDIRTNQITSIESGAFAGFGNVTSLLISSNQITALDNRIFSGLNKITSLSLDTNPIVSIESGAFSGLPKLTSLSLKLNQFSSIDSGTLAGLTGLTTLTIESGQVSSIESGSFAKLTKLTSLKLNFNKLISIDSGMFVGLTGLTTLYIQGNPIVSIESGAFSGLSKVSLLALAGNKITSLDAGDLTGLPKLEDLYLFSNEITSIESGTFSGLPLLDSIYLSMNKITSIESGTFSGLLNLRLLDLYSNQLTTINAEDFGRLNLRYLDMHNNQITTINPGTFSSFSGLDFLSLNGNKITTIESGTFNGLSILTNLYLNENPISTIDSGSFSPLSNINNIYISPSCNTNGNQSIPKTGGSINTDNDYCVLVTTSNASDFITQLGDRSYELSNGYYRGDLAISFNHPASSNTFLANVAMTTTNKNNYVDTYYTTTGEVKYTSGTNITHNGQPFTGVLQSPIVFSTGNVPGITGVVSLMRFGALIESVDFSQAVTVSMPAIGKSIGDQVGIYSSEKESIYNSDPQRTFEKTGTVIDKDGIPYIEFTTTHASRYVVSSNIPTIAPVVIPTTPSVNGGGGGTTVVHADVCPTQRDCSDSYYDNLCGKCSLIDKIFDKLPFHNAADLPVGSIKNSSFSTELNNAYVRAYSYGITTMPTIQKANIEGVLIRKDMAKMIVNFARTILKKDISTGAACEFADMKALTKEAQYYAIAACRLGLMGWESDGLKIKATFDPNQEVDRAQFGTILSRLLRQNTYNSNDINYYTNHLTALKKEGIMTKIDSPSSKELRGWVILMMQRIADKK